MGLPIPDEDDEYEVDSEGKTFLTKYTCSATETYFEIPSSKALIITPEIRIHIIFDRQVTLEYVACSFEKIIDAEDELLN